MTKGKNSLVLCTNLLYILAYLYHFLLRHEDFLKARLMAQVSGGDPAKDKYGGLRERRQVAESREPQPSQSEGTSSGVKSLHDLQQRTERQLDSISSRMLSPRPGTLEHSTRATSDSSVGSDESRQGSASWLAQVRSASSSDSVTWPRNHSPCSPWRKFARLPRLSA